MATMMQQLCSGMARRMVLAGQNGRGAGAAAASIASCQQAQLEVCGRGDKRTKRGKRFKGSYGNARPKRKKMIQRLKDKLEVPRSTPWPLPFKLI